MASGHPVPKKQSGVPHERICCERKSADALSCRPMLDPMIEIVASQDSHQPCPPGRKIPPTDTQTAEPLWREVLGDQLRNQRRERDETLTQVAARAGVSPQYLSEIERGLKEPSSEMIAAISGALDLTLVDLTISVARRLGAYRLPASQPHCRTAFALAA